MNTVRPTLPVRTQIYTYSESGGTCVISLNLLNGGTSLFSRPIPTPQGASVMYLRSVALFMSRTPNEASSLSNTVLMRRIWEFPFPIFVNARKYKAIRNKVPAESMTFRDLHRMMNIANPAIRHAMAVRVPDEKKAQIAMNPITRKNMRRRLIFIYIPTTINITAADAKWTPKFAASEKQDMYLILPPIK